MPLSRWPLGPRSIRTGSGKNGATSREPGTRTPNDVRTATPTQASDRLAACAAKATWISQDEFIWHGQLASPGCETLPSA
jgi:hypothetical protein